MTHQVKVEAGKSIAGVMERADTEAAERYRERLDEARKEAATAKTEAVTARSEAAREKTEAAKTEAAREKAATARRKAKTAGDRATRAERKTDEVREELEGELEQANGRERVLTDTLELAVQRVKERDGLEKERDGLKRRLAGVPKKVEEAVKAAVAQRDCEWRPFLKQEVDKATAKEEERGSTALQEAKQRADTAEQLASEAQEATGFAEGAMEEMRGERDEAQGERDQARPRRRRRTGTIGSNVSSRWLRDLNPGRAELERATGRAGIGGQWLAQEGERGRGGMDR